MRFRFAPSSMLENYSNGKDERCDNIISHSSPEAETIFARFMSTCSGNDSSSPDVMRQIINKSMEQEPERINGFLPSLQMGFHSPPPQPPPPPPPEISLENQSSNPTENSYRNSNSMHVDQQQHHHSKLKMGSGGSNSSTTNSSNLIRHSSSPAGLFSQLSVEKGYTAMRGIGDFRAKNNSTNGDKTAPIISRLKSQLSFPSRPPSSSSLLSQISEVENESMEEGNSREEGSLGSGNNPFLTGFTNASWKDSAEMATILQLQDAVPCKIRAKRGYATHPRSIAERVRRTRISERMRKLQELVPNMDKQTNTADMLDFAVEYIKDLQKQVKTLNANRANCVCSRQKL